MGPAITSLKIYSHNENGDWRNPTWILIPNASIEGVLGAECMVAWDRDVAHWNLLDNHNCAIYIKSKIYPDRAYFRSVGLHPAATAEFAFHYGVDPNGVCRWAEFNSSLVGFLPQGWSLG